MDSVCNILGHCCISNSSQKCFVNEQKRFPVRIFCERFFFIFFFGQKKIPKIKSKKKERKSNSYLTGVFIQPHSNYKSRSIRYPCLQSYLRYVDHFEPNPHFDKITKKNAITIISIAIRIIRLRIPSSQIKSLVPSTTHIILTLQLYLGPFFSSLT
jgi:hypothetical protein